MPDHRLPILALSNPLQLFAIAHRAAASTTPYQAAAQSHLSGPPRSGTIDRMMRLDRPEIVARPRGVRPMFVLTLLLALSLAALVATRGQPVDRAAHRGPVADWFTINKAHCNAVEVTTFLASHLPGLGADAIAQRAACLAIAGKIDAARLAITELPEDMRSDAASYVFGVAHPVADAGDNASAAPIMELVIEFQPGNYMALYHAGMAAAATGEDVRARDHLTRFVAIYHGRDYWTQSAQQALRAIDHPRSQRIVIRGREGTIVY